MSYNKFLNKSFNGRTRSRKKSGNPHMGKKLDYSAKGVATPYFSSNGWRAKTNNVKETFSMIESNANRNHEASLATQAKFHVEDENWANRRHQLRMKWGPLAKLLDDYD